MANAMTTMAHLETSLFNLERFLARSGLRSVRIMKGRLPGDDNSDEESEKSNEITPFVPGPLSLFNLRNPKITGVGGDLVEFINTATAVHEGMRKKM